MQRFRLRTDALEVDSFAVAAPAGWRGGAVGVEDEAHMTGNDHCTGPSEVLPSCATCNEVYDTCAETCYGTCYPCWTGEKPICLDG
jgi:hypothetical protein